MSQGVLRKTSTLAASYQSGKQDQKTLVQVFASHYNIQHTVTSCITVCCTHPHAKPIPGSIWPWISTSLPRNTAKHRMLSWLPNTNGTSSSFIQGCSTTSCTNSVHFMLHTERDKTVFSSWRGERSFPSDKFSLLLGNQAMPPAAKVT